MKHGFHRTHDDEYLAKVERRFSAAMDEIKKADEAATQAYRSIGYTNGILPNVRAWQKKALENQVRRLNESIATLNEMVDKPTPPHTLKEHLALDRNELKEDTPS